MKLLHQNVIIPQGLINDNWFGYLDWWIYKEEITWMEKTVATPYWTGMTLFSIDRRHTQHRHKHNLLDNVYESRGRVLFKGQLFSAPMDWKSVLEQLEQGVHNAFSLFVNSETRRTLADVPMLSCPS